MTPTTDPTRKSEAQPDEWTVSEHEDNGDIIIRDGDGDIIANCQVDSQGFSDTQVEANAAAIVRDHNAGPGLRAACQLAAFQFDACARRFRGMKMEGAAQIEEDCAKGLREALAKAGA